MHEEASQLQSMHEPVLGPLEVPVAHVPVSAHHPHEAPPVHDSQSDSVAHVSVGPAHSKLSQAHAEVQAPASGPLDVPERQAPSHQPHPGLAVHALQSVALAHGSVGPVHSLERHVQPLQVPVLGPLEVPTPQVPVSVHHPHANWLVQSPQFA